MRKAAIFSVFFLLLSTSQLLCVAADSQEATGILNQYISYYENRGFPSYFVGATTNENTLIIFSTDTSQETMADISNACGSTQFKVKLCEYSLAELEAFQLAVLKNKEQYGISGSSFDFDNSGVVFYVDELPANYNNLPLLEKKLEKEYSSYPAAMTVRCEYAPWAAEESLNNHDWISVDYKSIFIIAILGALIYSVLIFMRRYVKRRL